MPEEELKKITNLLRYYILTSTTTAGFLLPPNNVKPDFLTGSGSSTTTAGRFLVNRARVVTVDLFWVLGVDKATGLVAMWEVLARCIAAILCWDNVPQWDHYSARWSNKLNITGSDVSLDWIYVAERCVVVRKWCWPSKGRRSFG